MQMVLFAWLLKPDVETSSEKLVNSVTMVIIKAVTTVKLDLDGHVLAVSCLLQHVIKMFNAEMISISPHLGKTVKMATHAMVMVATLNAKLKLAGNVSQKVLV